MKILSPIRAGLLSAALFLTTALASPALANSMPELSPRQIAQDVKQTYYPRTDTHEYIAPSFDPFEDDHELAGSAQLRAGGQVIAIEGYELKGGAVLDLAFYYNSDSDDPYDNRGYVEAAFLSGELASVVRRDNRVLECSQNISDVVYYHEDYYAPRFARDLYRPFRHYSGFNGYRRNGYSGFGHSGFGHDGFSYGGFGGSSFGLGHGRTRSRLISRGRFGTRGARGFRGRTGIRGLRDGRRGRSDTLRRDGQINDNQVNEGQVNEGQANVQPENSRRRDIRPRDSRPRDIRPGNIGSREGRNGARINDGRQIAPAGNSNNQEQDRQNTVVLPRTPLRAESEPINPRDINNGTRRSRAEGRRAAPFVRRVIPKQSAPNQAASRSAARSAPPKSRSSGTKRNDRQARSTRHQARNRSNPRQGLSRSTRSIPSGGFRGKRMIALSPMTSLFGRKSRTVQVQCAREESLTIHIPQERLDAARFDGLTVIVLDRKGHELPVFIPPNYIEGFRQATGRPAINSSGYTSSSPESSIQEQSIQEPQIAMCPTGTRPLADGSCTTLDYPGYPQ